MSAHALPDRRQLADGLDAVGADAWLLFDFHGLNPVAGRVLGLGGMGSRRLFVLLPKEGEPVAVVHKIEMQPLEGFPGRLLPYARWEELHAALGSIVKGRTLAMEISPDDAVPYLDRVPFGVVQLITRLGGRVVPSSSLVTRFAARWSAEELADHRYAAEALADIARAELAWAVRQGGTGLTETALQARVVAAMEARGLKLTTRPIVGFGPNAANPHYEPEAGKDATLAKDQVILLDLWGGRGSTTTVFADQTWMGFSGAQVPQEVERVWRTVRDARDAPPRPSSRGPGREGRWQASRGTARRGPSSRGQGTGSTSSTGPDTPLTGTSMGRARTWMTTRPTTTGSCSPESDSPSSPVSIYLGSLASAAKSTCTGVRTGRR